MATNKIGADKILSVYWFAILFIVASGIFAMVYIFYGSPYDVRDIESNALKMQIANCLSQGGYFAEKVNWEKFLYDPKKISAVFITHAHIDHTGRLPKLIKEGFRGKIYGTAPTRDFAKLLFYDSIDILKKEAEKTGRAPLYNETEADEAIRRWQITEYEEKIKIGKTNGSI